MNSYNPELCVKADMLYKEGKYEDALKLALSLHKLAVEEAKNKWHLTVNESTDLFKKSQIWDSTSEKYVDYDTFIKIHNWQDDIAPAPIRIAAKSLRALAKTIKLSNPNKAIEYLNQIRQLDQASQADIRLLEKLQS